MGKKISLGVVIALMAITAAIAVSLTYMFSLKRFNEVIPEFNERQRMYDKIAEIDQTVRQDFLGEIDETKLKDGLSAGYMAGLGDAQGQYLTAEKYKEYLAGVSEKFVGIGVETIEDEDGNMEIVTVLPGTPAEQNGLQKGDVILSVDGKDVRRIGYSDALNRLDGSVGSTVEIRLLRVTSADVPETEEDGEAQEPAEATTETLTVSIVRSEYSENTVSYRLINEKIGCIAISEFTSQTKEQFDAALQSLQANGAAALIFDLRNNSGGSMEVAADILDDLLPAGNLVSVKDKQGNVTVEFTSDAKEVGLPMTALVNDKTYGPAELFAAAIRQYKKIGLVGETTAGSGAKNKVLALSDGSAIIFSVASYITPEGAEFDGVGIEPDHPVVLTEGQRAQLNRKLLSDANDPQMQTALNVLSEAGVDTAPPVSEPEASAESAQSEEAAQ